MANITTSSTLPAPVQLHFGQKLLAVPVPNLVYSLGAEQFVMPQNAGTTLRRRRYEKWATATVPLGNSGLTPPAQSRGVIDIDCTIQFYGTYIILNEQVTLQNEDPKRQDGVSKSSLIDLEAYSESHGDRAQAEHFALAA